MAKTNTTQKASAPALTPEQIAIALKGMTDDARKALLHGLKSDGVSVSAAGTPKEKVYVAQRVFTKDSSATARIKRTAGEVQPLTEKSLMAILETWVKGKDATTKIPLIKQSVLSGHTEAFSTFRLEPYTPQQ